MGRGTRTNIYSGRLLTQEREESDNDEFNNNSHRGHRVVLKILDQTHEDIALVSCLKLTQKMTLYYAECKRLL